MLAQINIHRSQAGQWKGHHLFFLLKTHDRFKNQRVHSVLETWTWHPNFTYVFYTFFKTFNTHSDIQNKTLIRVLLSIGLLHTSNLSFIYSCNLSYGAQFIYFILNASKLEVWVVRPNIFFYFHECVCGCMQCNVIKCHLLLFRKY